MRFNRWAAERFELPGRLFIVPPGETLAVWNEVGRETVVVCYLRDEVMDAWVAQKRSTDLLDNSADVHSEALSNVMLRLRDEACRPGFASEMMIEGLVLQLAVELQRHYRDVPQSLKGGGLAPWRLRRIEDRLRCYGEPATLSELAALCSLSVRQLSRAFRASQGISIGQFAARIRIEEAKRQLAGDVSIKQLASRLGFCSTAAFSFAFRNATGVTPSQFRTLSWSRR
jgi:AraC family transcriptional regulator